MPCDGKNKSCERRRELLHQLKCLISTMERKKPCEWDEKPCPSSEPPKCQTVACYTPCPPLGCKPICKPNCPPPKCPPPCEPVIRLTVDPLCISSCKPLYQPPGLKGMSMPISKPSCPLMCIQKYQPSCSQPCSLQCLPQCPIMCPVPSKQTCPARCPSTCPICPVPYKPVCPPTCPPPCPTCPKSCKPVCLASKKSKTPTPKSCYSLYVRQPSCAPLKPCKSFELRSSFLHKCQCIRRDGLQDKCLMSDCMGYPECITKLFPICGPGQCALMKLCYMGGS